MLKIVPEFMKTFILQQKNRYEIISGCEFTFFNLFDFIWVYSLIVVWTFFSCTIYWIKLPQPLFFCIKPTHLTLNNQKTKFGDFRSDISVVVNEFVQYLTYRNITYLNGVINRVGIRENFHFKTKKRCEIISVCEFALLILFAISGLWRSILGSFVYKGLFIAHFWSYLIDSYKKVNESTKE